MRFYENQESVSILFSLEGIIGGTNPYCDSKGFIILFFNNLSTCLEISSLWKRGNLYCLEKIRERSTFGIESCITLVVSSGSPGI